VLVVDIGRRWLEFKTVTLQQDTQVTNLNPPIDQVDVLGIFAYMQRLGLEPMDPQHLGGEWDFSAFK